MHKPNYSFSDIMISREPDAIANIVGNAANPRICGTASFYEVYHEGILIQVEVSGLPDKGRPHAPDFYGMHIHQFGNCTPPFNKTGTHYNPYETKHPYHTGDLPPLLSVNGYAWIAFYNPLLSISEISGKSIVIHSKRDDFTTDPSGDSGDKIACGAIYYK